MKAPQRLIESNDPEVRQLLRASHSLPGSARSRRRVLTALGLSSSTAWGLLSSAWALVAPAAKLVLVGGLVFSASSDGGTPPGTLSAGAHVSAGAESSAHTALPTEDQARVLEHDGVPEENPSASPTSPGNPPSAQVEEPLTDRPATKSRADAVAAHTPVAPQSPDSRLTSASHIETEPPGDALETELRLLHAAAGATQGGNPARALKLLRDYDARFARGKLRLEATALRVEALQVAGQRERARQLAERFLEHHPNSVLSARVRRATQ